MRRLRASFKRSCVFSGERSRRVPAHGLKLSRTPEPILQLQRQLEDFRSSQPGRVKLPDSLWQAAVGSAIRPLAGRASFTAGLYAFEETPVECRHALAGHVGEAKAAPTLRTRCPNPHTADRRRKAQAFPSGQRTAFGRVARHDLENAVIGYSSNTFRQRAEGSKEVADGRAAVSRQSRRQLLSSRSRPRPLRLPPPPRRRRVPICGAAGAGHSCRV